MSQPNLDEFPQDFGDQAQPIGGEPQAAVEAAEPMGIEPVESAAPAPAAAPTPKQKQRFNVYTMMLLISFFCIVTACVLLWLELSDYMEESDGWPPWDTSAATPTSYHVPASSVGPLQTAAAGDMVDGRWG